MQTGSQKTQLVPEKNFVVVFVLFIYYLYLFIYLFLQGTTDPSQMILVLSFPR